MTRSLISMGQAVLLGHVIFLAMQPARLATLLEGYDKMCAGCQTICLSFFVELQKKTIT